MDERIKRDRGILTQSDREYLRGESDLEPKSHGERVARERIRKRIANSIIDLEVVGSHLQRRDWNQLVDSLDEDEIKRAITVLEAMAALKETRSILSDRGPIDLFNDDKN